MTDVGGVKGRHLRLGQKRFRRLAVAVVQARRASSSSPLLVEGAFDMVFYEMNDANAAVQGTQKFSNLWCDVCNAHIILIVEANGAHCWAINSLVAPSASLGSSTPGL
jgi:hypothetical protein